MPVVGTRVLKCIAFMHSCILDFRVRYIHDFPARVFIMYTHVK